MKPSDCLKTTQPCIGNYVMLFNVDVGVIVDIVNPIEGEGHLTYLVFNINQQKMQTLYDYDIRPISEEFVEYSLNLTFEMRNKIYSLSENFEILENNFDNEDDILFINELNLLDDILSKNLTRQVQSVIFADGIDSIIGREKGKGIRIIKLKNGQIWKAHRVKNKYKPLRKKIATQYATNARLKNHTTHYELITQLN